MKKLLIVVDFQVDFVTGALGFPKAKEVEEVIYEKIKLYQKNNDDIIFTFDTHDDNYLNTVEGKKLPIVHCIKGTKGHALYGKVNEFKDRGVSFEKPTFGSLDLGIYLKDKNYQEIEVCGLVSNICVISNAVIAKSAIPNAVIKVDAKATASFDEDLHEKALDVLEGLHVEVVNR
ncbi:MAG TPA: cysteine hydrolase [Acholeplasmataceae bacterium]|nr:cysteine hydrolase [Acholeplasmataceae bacterium]